MAVQQVKISASPKMVAYRNSATLATFVQAWRIHRPGKDVLIVYTHDAVMEELAKGHSVEVMTVIRWDNGERTYQLGSLASQVARYYEEGRQPPRN